MTGARVSVSYSGLRGFAGRGCAVTNAARRSWSVFAPVRAFSHPPRWQLPAILALILLAFAAPVYAQGDGVTDCKIQPEQCIALPPKEAARLAARDAELDAVQRQVTALEAVVAAQARQIEAQQKIIVLQDQEIARRERITALADEESAIHRGRADRVEAAACSEVRKARALGYAGAVGGAMMVSVIGAPYAPIGALVAGIVGYIMPCP